MRALRPYAAHGREDAAVRLGRTGDGGVDAVIKLDPLGLDLPRRTVTSVSMQLQMGLVTTQSYLTMHPSSLVRFAGRRFAVKALPIELAVEPRLIGIITLKNRTISPAAQVFVQAVREAAKPMAKPRKCA